MYKSDAKIFGEAILYGLTNRYEREMALDSEDDTCSDGHINTILTIIKNSTIQEKKKSKGRLIAALIAAALLLAGCTAYIYRNQISSFVETYFNEWIRVNIDDEGGEYINVINDVYELTYIPEGYELDGKFVDDVGVTYIYQDNNGNTITFNQISLGSSYSIDIDNDTDEVTVLKHNGKEIYFRNTEILQVYIWRDENYIMDLNVSSSLPQEEALRIIDEIK